MDASTERRMQCGVGEREGAGRARETSRERKVIVLDEGVEEAARVKEAERERIRESYCRRRSADSTALVRARVLSVCSRTPLAACRSLHGGGRERHV